ncbi:hypothetical protein RDABS01_034481, partial [Bienertia sinuspersici]
MASLPVLPTEIVMDEILPRLPARFLIRFKSVNKFFRTLISSRKFIDLHLHQCLSSNTNRFLILGDNCSEQRLYWLDLDSPITAMIKLPSKQSSADRLVMRYLYLSLSLFTRDKFNCYLWIMKEYGVKESWHTFIINEHHPFTNSTCMLYTMVSAYRRETRKDELLVRIARQK